MFEGTNDEGACFCCRSRDLLSANDSLEFLIWEGDAYPCLCHTLVVC